MNNYVIFIMIYFVATNKFKIIKNLLCSNSKENQIIYFDTCVELKYKELAVFRLVY